jgi:hypothetical protein
MQKWNVNRARYVALLKQIRVKEVSFGSGGVELFNSRGLNRAQIGYAVTPDGKPLTGTRTGDWRESWFVIGNEILCGDPLFIELNDESLPVSTASHGEGAWKPIRVAPSFTAFAQSLEKIAEAAREREYPDALDRNPLTSREKRTLLAELRRLNPGCELSFWSGMFESD